MQKIAVSKWLRRSALAAAVLAIPSLALSSRDAGAMGTEPPKPKIDCAKKANKGKPECQQNNNGLTDDQVYYGGYWLARSGKYQEALDLLRTARNQSDPRILNYIGFTTRKLGRVDEAMGYYAKALEINPGYTVARAYLGEAFLQKGDAAGAKQQLAEIAKRCGTTCEEHAELAGHIETFERTAAAKG